MDWVTLGLYALPLLLGVLAYIRNSLDLAGSITGVILGYAFLFLGLPYMVLLLAFFLLGTLVTRIGYSRKRKLGQHQKTRGIWNVLGNALAGLIFALLGNPYAVASSFSAAMADTASSEIGLLSREKPVSILTGKPVKPGYDGGITTLGSSASIFFAFLIALIALYYWGWPGFWISLMGGIFGSILDSILGDAFESRGYWGNHTTNFLATLGAGILGFLLSLIL